MQELLELALEEPDRAQTLAERVLASSGDPVERSYAHQSLGIVLRDRGSTEAALTELRSALRYAARDRDRERDVRATYGATLAFDGRNRAGLAQLDRALDGATGVLAAKIRLRKAGVLGFLGRHQEAAAAARTALAEVRSAGSPEWEGRARVWLGHLELRLGRVDSAEREIAAAERLFGETGAALARLTAVENLAEIAVARGDLARGLRTYAAALAGYRAAGIAPRWELVRLYAEAYLAAGMPSAAAALLEELVGAVDLPAVDEAARHLLRASALLAGGDAEAAVPEARSARAMFRRQRNDWGSLRARLALVQARDAADDRRDLAREARDVAGRLHEEGADEAPRALALAGRLTDGPERSRLWRAAAAYRDRANGLVRASAYLAGALEREGQDDRRGVLRACTAGLAALDEHRRLIGSSELRALATSHGRELTGLALRHAAHDPRTLLRWSERTRATALAQPSATSDAATIPPSLAALRDNGRQLADARREGAPTAELERERRRLERAVRAEHHARSATDVDDRQGSVTAEEVVAGVGEGCLVELVEVDGTLHVLVVHGGRVRRRVAGSAVEVAALLGPASMLLRRAARGRPARTDELGRRLQAAVLGDAVGLLPEGPVVLVPTARLHGLAWALLPALAGRPFSVVPSAGQWLRAREVRRPARRRTLLVAGPGLESGGAEVPVLAGRHPDAVLLEGSAATVDAVLASLDGADLAHLATHGRFRADSPLFSALDLADGPLTVHDLERLRRAPYRVVLSACESGVLAPVGAAELLGLAAALFSLGTAGLVSSVGEVNDAATADLMVALHDGLARGADPAGALLGVRRHAAGDSVAAATAAAFVALGV